MIEISRKAYCDMYGPTVGDRVRLGDTSLIAEVEKDLTVHGDEAKFGGGKSLRDGMGQSCKATDKADWHWDVIYVVKIRRAVSHAEFKCFGGLACFFLDRVKIRARLYPQSHFFRFFVGAFF